MVRLEEAADAEHVENDRNEANGDAHARPGACGKSDQWSNKREDHIGEQAADSRDHNRLGKDALGLRLIFDR